MAAASNPAALGSLFSEKVNRAVELKKKRNFDEAIVLFTELLSARESVAGERDVNALILRDHIGSCLVGAAQYSAAEDYQRETLRRWKRVPSVEGKKKTAHASHELAKTLLKRSDENGDRDGVARMESVQLLKVKLNYLTRGTRERDEGSILNVLDHLAFVLSDLGRFEEAEKVDRDALKSALKIHSGDPEHEQIMDFRLRIADDLAGCGKATEAKVMYEEVLKLLTRRTTETRRSLSAKKLQEYITWCSDGILSMKSAIESAQEEARKRKTEEAKRQAEETKRQAEETKRQAEEAKRQAEENKRRAEEETKRREQEEAEKREEEAEARRKARALKRAEAQKKVEAKRREEEAQKIAEDEKRAEAQRLALEAAQKEAEAREREEARKKKEAKRLADAIVKAEAAKRAEVQKKEEARRIRYRRRRAQKRWQKAIKKVKLILRVIAALKSYRAQGKWRKAFLKVRVTLKVSAVVKAYRVQIRWQRCFVKIKPVIKLASALRSRRAHRKWSQAFTKITLCLKVVAALKALRARRRWHRALRKVSLVLCVAAKAKSIRIRKRWHQAMECALLTVKVISFTVRLRVCARWKKTLAIAMTQAKVTVMVRRLRVRGRWIRATEKVIVRNRLLDRLRSWHSEVVSTRRQRRDDSAIRIPGSWIGAEYGEENRDLIDRQEESELDTDYEEGMQASLYDAQEAESSSPSTEKWIKEFASLSTFLSKQSKDGDSKIKVAILDTGIDATHPFVKKRWHRSDIMDRGYRDFVSNVVNTTPEDQDGHGTHVAGIILRFAPNAELYIARIAETNESCQKDKYINGKVAAALKHALDSWEVDMVSMSFGLTNEDPEIKRQILRAYEKDVPLFAAACNDGSRKAVSYPANHILVYCINACDGDGKEAFFNPPARPNSLNFSILGMNVQSAWPAFEGGDPASKQKKGCFISQEKVLRGTTAKYMSGTSVATPFAVALVASVCAYERVNAALVSSEQKVKSHEGVKKLLKGMSRTVNGFDTIVPWDGRGSRFKDYKVIFADSLRFTLREQY